RLMFSPDGTQLAFFDSSGNVKLWNTTSSHEPPDFQGSLVHPWKIMLRDAESSSHELQTFPRGNLGSFTQSVWWGQGGVQFRSCDSYGRVKLWDSASGHALSIILMQMGLDESEAFGPNVTRLGSAGSDEKVKLWDAIRQQVQNSAPRWGRVWREWVFSADGAR